MKKQKVLGKNKTVESYFAKIKISGEIDNTPKKDVYLDALEKQLKAADQKVVSERSEIGSLEADNNDCSENLVAIADTTGVSKNQADSDKLNEALKYITKLEGMLQDEKNAKNILLENLKQVNRKYLKTLTMLTKVQSDLLRMRGCAQEEKNVAKKTPPDAISSPAVPELVPLLIAQYPVKPETFLTDAEITILDKMRNTKNFDSAYVREMMQFIFKERNSLIFRTVSGRTQGTQKFSKFSPEKLNFIYHLFQKRIDNCGDTNDKSERLNLLYINKLISSARCNMLRSENTKENNNK